MRKLATAAFSFSAGIFLAQYLLPLNRQLPLGLAIAALGLLGLVKRGTARLRILLIAGGLAASLAYNWAYVQAVQLPAEELADSDQAGVTMRLLDYAQETEYGAKATVFLQTEQGRRVRTVYYGGRELLELAPGWTVTDDVHLESAARIQEDLLTQFTSRGVFLLAYGGGEAAVDRGSEASLRWLPVRCARAMQDRIHELFSGDAAGFLVAILTGDPYDISDLAATDLSEAGVYHILAVSGMHCAFLLSVVVLFTGKHRRRLVAAAAIPALLFFMVLTGCRPSTVRSCIMLIFLLTAPLFRRDSDPPTAMAAALLVILLQNPFAAASVSLQLSFAAAAGLIWISPGLYRLLLKPEKRHGRAARFAAASVAATLGVTVSSAPLGAYYFNTFWLVSPLSNLLCLWAASLIFGFGLAAVALSVLFYPLGAVVGVVPRGLIWYLLQTCHLLARIPYHAVYFSNPYLKYWLTYLYVLLGTAYFHKPPARRKYAWAAVLAALSLAVTVQLGKWDGASGALNIVALDVGQGESVALASAGQFALIDCGSKNSWYSPGDIAAERLQSIGCGTLDYLLLTHYDSDHINGVEQLLSRVNVKRILLPDSRDDAGLREKVTETARRWGVTVEYVRKKSVFQLGQATLTVFPPLGEDPTEDNDQGLSFLASAGDFDLLVTGDMSDTTEQTLLETYDLPDIEVLVAGHHGSKHATSAALLEALRPEAAIISVGSNSYGHPTLQTLHRLDGAGVRVYRTDLQGAIHLSVN